MKSCNGISNSSAGLGVRLATAGPVTVQPRIHTRRSAASIWLVPMQLVGSGRNPNRRGPAEYGCKKVGVILGPWP